MKSLLRQFHQVIPPIWIIVAFVTGEILILLFHLPFWFFSEPIPDELEKVAVVFVCLFGAVLGLRRCTMFHPVYNSRYFVFLALSPWQYGKELPSGPVHLVWADVVVLLVLGCWASISGSIYFILPAFSFIVVYLLLLYIGIFFCGQFGAVTAALFIVPFSIYPFQDGRLLLVVIPLLYVLGYFSLRMFLKEFPWNSGYWKSDPVKELRKKVFSSNIIKWPYSSLKVFNPNFVINAPVGITLSVLITWWVFAIERLFLRPVDINPFVLLGIAIFVISRLVIYSVQYRPPISFWGRIFTLRLIIPGYDKVFVAPILMVLAMWFGSKVFRSFGFGSLLSWDMILFIVLLICFIVPPGLVQWRLTGSHRIPKPPASQQMARASRKSSELDRKVAGWLADR